MIHFILFSILIIILIHYCLKKYIYNESIQELPQPPGPRGIPFLGSLLSMGLLPHETFMKWSKKYGPIVKARIGSTNIIVLDNAKVIREAFNETVFSGRPDNELVYIMPGSKIGVVSTDGPEWIEQRRFIMRNLRDFGFGKQSIGSLIMDEVEEVLKWMRKNSGVGVSMNKKFTLAALNALWTIVAGKRSEIDDPIIHNIIDSTNDTFIEVFKSGFLLFFPELIQVLPQWILRSFYKAKTSAAKFREIFLEAVEEHYKNPADENSPRDFIDVYINEINRTKDTSSSFYSNYGKESLVAVVGDLYVAGYSTTSITLTWAVLYISTFTQVQNKLQNELDNVVGKYKSVSLSDRPNLPYTEALIMEILRYSSIAPFGAFHTALEDTIFQGYAIKKNSMIISNIYSAHFNKEIWTDPQNFRPERFLSSDETQVIKNENLIAFSAGKRQCLGESLARDNIFLFLTNIFKSFEIIPDPAEPPPSLEPAFGFLLEPKKFNVVFNKRK